MPKETKSQDKSAQSKPAAKTPAAKAESAAQPSAKGKTTERPPAKAKSTTREKKLARVPEQYIFYCCDGSVYRDMAELAVGLAAMTDEAFAYHCNSEKQDFANWVRDIIEDIELANDLAMARRRSQAADCVADRLVFLTQ